MSVQQNQVRSALPVGRTPWSAADALVGLLGLAERRVLGDPRGPGGPPHSFTKSEETTRWNKAKMM
jgi:hypothetical protein